MTTPNWPHLVRYAPVFGVLTLLAVWGVCGMFAGWRVQQWWCGADKKPSTSKFQLFLWTTVVLFAYSTITARFILKGLAVAIDPKCGTLPSNILVVLGLSGATAAVAKGITVGYINSGRLTKNNDAAPGAPTGGVLTSDEGEPDLSKLQVTAWTFVAIVIYLIQFFRALPSIPGDGIDAPGCAVPDIDATLMVLMGLSQGAYVGKKLVTMDTPRIASITPQRGPIGTVVTVHGASFGAAQQGSTILIDGQPVPLVATSWADAQITFSMPLAQPSGIAWSPGPHTISLLVGGRAAEGALAFTLTPPTITAIAPGIAKPGTAVTLYGFFGAPDPTSVVLMDGTLLPAGVSWAQDTITVLIPSQYVGGAAWQANQNVQLSVRVQGIVSNAMLVTIT